MPAQDLTRYDYRLPEELIAIEPIEPRDAAKLMVYIYFICNSIVDH